MKTNLNAMFQKHIQRAGRKLVLANLFIAAGCCVSCDPEYDLDEKLPPNFGSNLMNYLESKNFENYCKLAKDLDYYDALSGVTLKTVFAADDEAFERFYANNKWGVKSYDELTLAQKKLLFYGSMLDNSLQIMTLASTTGSEGPLPGKAMRRTTSVSYLDTVPVITCDEMPKNNPAWRYYRENNKSIVCMKDNSAAPLMFLTETFLANNKITNEDVDFLYNIKNAEEKRQPGDANVANTAVVERNIRTANGFIHRTKDVIVPTSNMAEVIRTNPKSQIFSRLLERFSAPYPLSDEATRIYNNQYGTSIDTLFAKHYYAQRSTGGRKNTTMPNNRPAVNSLTFDPGWNGFYTDDPSETRTEVLLQQNMGVMLVPTDDVMQDFWDNGVGRAFQDVYGDWDSIPDLVVAKLINNCMKESWVNTVPSKFKDVLNTNNDPMNLTVEDIDKVEIACNGAIYWTNKVFSPTEFVSVCYPAFVNTKVMNILWWAIDHNRLNFTSYLNSLDSYYSFFIPTNEALLSYVDPVKYKGIDNEIWEFQYDAKATPSVWAKVYKYSVATGEKGEYLRDVKDEYAILDRLEDVLDNHIVVGSRIFEGNVENGHEYYRTKNGGIIRMKQENGNWYVQGTLQRDQNKWLKITKVYDQTKGGNGKTYVIGADEEQTAPEPIMTTRKSTFDILSEHEEFSVFYDMLMKSDLLSTSPDGMGIASSQGNVDCFRNFNYTVYVPTNASLEAAIKAGRIHTWEEIEELQERGENGDNLAKSNAEKYAKEINDFLRYHIQDNLLMLDLDYSTEVSVKVDGAGKPIINDENGNRINPDNFTRSYETAAINASSKKFYALEVTSTRGELTVKDRTGNERHVLKNKDANGEDLYNLVVREYKLSGNIEASSFAAIHLIDGPLFYKK